MDRITGRNKKGDLLVNGKMVYAGEFYEIASILEEYENLEEQGKLLILPCKPGDTVYVISNYSNYRKNNSEIIKAVVTTVRLKNDGKTVMFSCRGKWKNQNPYIGNFVISSVGKAVFITEQEAREALDKEESN